MTQLSVNMNVAALLRNRRGHPWPDVPGLARAALTAGAAGLTLHPRPDARHATAEDAWTFRRMIDAHFPNRELNIEGYPDPRFLSLVEAVRPEQVTLVSDAPDQATSDHGWDFRAQAAELADWVARLKSAGCRVALFADAEAAHMSDAAATGADRVELYTGPYGSAHADAGLAAHELHRLAQAAMAARGCGLGVNAGHDLTVPGTRALLAQIPTIDEVSIGHALFCDALSFGMTETVRRYLSACQTAGLSAEPQ
ncbi:pyridoxine 5'-phosphate synthase [Dinoroseobacter sp. S375]|uniref:pyridoxine 5'-phosphate synthase n=1 Tax=Dinoroseobacter sp. S375 TaxID=3415136 RepID=UPI003C79C88E